MHGSSVGSVDKLDLCTFAFSFNGCVHVGELEFSVTGSVVPKLNSYPYNLHGLMDMGCAW